MHGTAHKFIKNIVKRPFDITDSRMYVKKKVVQVHNV